jgi:transposase
MTITYPIAGIDIGKDTLDISLLQANGSFEAFSFANEKASRKKLARRLQAKGVRLVVLEATGGYELPVMAALAEEGIAFARVNPARVRAFAKSMGQLAKTDRLDAKCLALYGERIRPQAHAHAERK